MAISTKNLSDNSTTGNKNMTPIHSAVNSLLILAIVNKDILHIDVTYHAYINEIEVKVFNQQTNYLIAHKRSFSCGVYLDSPNALNTLVHLQNKLIKLISDAKKKEKIH